MNAVARFWDSDVAFSFRNSPVAIVAAVVAFVLIFSAVFADWVAPHNPFDLATLNLLDASLPPSWERAETPGSGSAPMTRAETCSRRSCSGCRCRC
jgi:peptide/nickel transport system permease protein